MTDLISVVVPVYNVEKYLKKCVESIINQTYKNIEIILVDDGSTDNCGIICDSYKEKDERIKVFHKKNGGLSDARNRGIQEAKGKYITFIDSDDYINSNFINYLYQMIINYNSDISCCRFRNVYEGKKYIEEDVVEKIVFYNNIDAIKEMLYQKMIDNSACNKLYKIELFDDIRYPKSMYFEDLATTYKVFLKAKKIVASNKSLYYYYQRNGSILHNKNEKKNADLDNIVLEMKNNLINYSKLNDAVRCRILNAYFYIYRNSSDHILKQKSQKYILSNRKKVYKDKNITFKTRIGIITSYLGLNITNLFFYVYLFFGKCLRR